MLSTSAHKINGPKMIGFLYRRQESISLVLFAGRSRNKTACGNGECSSNCGFAKAVSIDTPEEKQRRQERYFHFKQVIIQRLTDAGVDFEVNGRVDPNNLNHVLNLWIKGISTYVLQTDLDLAGFAVSGGSACTAGSIEPSHVLTAMFGKQSPRISESIRISFGIMNTEEDVKELADAITEIVNKVKKVKELKNNGI